MPNGLAEFLHLLMSSNFRKFIFWRVHLLRLDLRASIWTQMDWEVASLLIHDTFKACQNSLRWWRPSPPSAVGACIVFMSLSQKLFWGIYNHAKFFPLLQFVWQLRWVELLRYVSVLRASVSLQCRLFHKLIHIYSSSY